MFFIKEKISSFKIFLTILFCQIFTQQTFALDPTKNLTDYLQRKWTIENGLPQNSITALIQSQEGYIWIVGSNVKLQWIDEDLYEGQIHIPIME